MTTIDRVAPARRSFFRDPEAPPATVVVPSVFCAVRGPGGQLLLVRRCDSGTWELPGGQVDIGETGGFSRRQIVQNDDRLPGRPHSVHNMRTDVSSTTGDEPRHEGRIARG